MVSKEKAQTKSPEAVEGGVVECHEPQSKDDFLEYTLKDAINITAAVLSLPSRDLRSAQFEKNTACELRDLGSTQRDTKSALGRSTLKI